MTISDKRQCYLFPVVLSDCVESLARHTIPEKLTFSRGQKTGGTLTIACENGFATELQHMQPIILERLAGYFGYQAVARIVISHSWIPAAAPQTAVALSPAPLPVECSQLADNIEDEELKAALQSLAHTLSGNTA